MKRRDGSFPADDFDERRAVDDLRTQLERLGERPVSVPPTYWPSLLVKTNRRVDEATSARALSISWAARVAIPGVVAILFFFIGLHYYVPEVTKKETSITSLINTLPDEAVDSILVGSGRLGSSLSPREVSFEVFQFSTDQITDYLVATGNTQTALDNMSDTDIAELLSALDTRKNL